jgi:hypothetical protein
MTPTQLVHLLGYEIQYIEKETVDSDVDVLGAYQPGTKVIKVTSNDHQTIYHELGHALHYWVFQKQFSFDNLLHLELVANIVSLNLCLLNKQDTDKSRTSFRYADEMDMYKALNVANTILCYITWKMGEHYEQPQKGETI